MVELTQHRLYHFPLVITEVIYDHKAHFLTGIQKGKNRLPHNIRTEQWRMGRAAAVSIKPPLILPGYELGKSGISLLTLLTEHLAHRGVGLLKRQIPLSQHTQHRRPLAERASRVYHITDVREILPVRAVSMLLHDSTAMQMLLQTQQYLHRIDRLNQVVRYLLTYSLLHDTLFLALGHHNNRQIRTQGLDIL